MIPYAGCKNMDVACLSPSVCLDFVSVDETGKVVSDEDAKVTIEGTLEDQEDVEKDDEGQEVIKVYIIKAHQEEEDLGMLELSSSLQHDAELHYRVYLKHILF